MTMDRAHTILIKMAKERYTSIFAVLAEFNQYQVDGECKHFWADENTACNTLLGLKVNVS